MASNILPAAAPLLGGIEAVAGRGPRNLVLAGIKLVFLVSLPSLAFQLLFHSSPNRPGLPGFQVTAGNALCNVVPGGLK